MLISNHPTREEKNPYDTAECLCQNRGRMLEINKEDIKFSPDPSERYAKDIEESKKEFYKEFYNPEESDNKEDNVNKCDCGRGDSPCDCCKEEEKEEVSTKETNANDEVESSDILVKTFIAMLTVLNEINDKLDVIIKDK